MTTHNVGHHPGASWLKVDLQCHTPRDRDWKNSDHLAGGGLTNEAMRISWAEDFVRACRVKGLSAVAITDHHDLCFIPYAQEAVKSLGVNLTIFPGLEITCDDDVQCLAIFDPSSGQEIWAKLLSKLPKVLQAPHDEKVGCVIKPAGINILDLFAEVAKDIHLKEQCVLLPHFSNDDAHKSLNSVGHHPRFVDLDCDGVYIERPFTSLNSVTVEKVHGKITEWGTRRRAVLATGDNRSASWERLGLHECWIKLGESSVEAIRQALLADEARVTYSSPELPSERIVELRVQSELCGKTPLTLSFNAGFTAVIGGRGSGKSAILEYLRFVLGRTTKDLPSSEPVSGSDRDSGFIEETLASGFVEVVIEREGSQETWRRELRTRDHILVKDAKGSESKITLDEARRRFRARAFYQKGLSSTTNKVNSAADQITGIAAAEALEKRHLIDQGIQKAKRTVTTALQQLAAHWQAKLELQQARSRVADIKGHLALHAERLAAEGVSAAALAVIAAAPSYDRGKAHLTDLERATVQDRQRIAVLKTDLLTLPVFTAPTFFTELNALAGKIDTARKVVNSRLDEAIQELAKLAAAGNEAKVAFDERAATFKLAYAEAVVQQAAHKTLLTDNERLTKELAEAEAAEARAVAAAKATEDAVLGMDIARKELSTLLDQRRAILTEAAKQVADHSSQVLKARVKRDPIPSEYMQTLFSLLEGSRVVDAQAKCEEWVRTAVAQDLNKAWATIGDRLLALYEDKMMSGAPEEPGEDISTTIFELFFNGAGLTAQQSKKIYASLNDTKVGAVLAAVPRDYIVLTYVDEGRDIAFEKASPGQQASALLELLLRQEAGTLIIDQPEDDLDNRVVMKIVQLIRTSKNKRQLIFTTHNPNMVVNGDADKVITLRSGEPSSAPVPEPPPRIAVELDGAIETPSVRSVITHIMEGGQDAFDLRSRKYRFDLYR